MCGHRDGAEQVILGREAHTKVDREHRATMGSGASERKGRFVSTSEPQDIVQSLGARGTVDRKSVV